MADEAGELWMERLPWVLLGRRTAYQTELDTTPAELVLGANPVIPGDMVGEPGPPLTTPQLKSLLDSLRAQAARPAIQTSGHREPPVHEPVNLDQVTHVRLKRHKIGPLQHTYEGPFRIIERVGKSCIRVHVGSYADGTPRHEVHHWENAKPAVLQDNQAEAEKKRRGRKEKGPKQEDTLSEKVTLDPDHPTNEPESKTHETRPKRITRRPARYSG